MPEGEKYYYFALIQQSLDLDASALEAWDRFLASGAYPQFADRARRHRATIAGRLAAGMMRATRQARSSTAPPAATR